MFPNEFTPYLGQDLNVRLTTQIDDTRWTVTASGLPFDWTAILKSSSTNLYQPNDETSSWILRTDAQKKTVVLTDSEFGRSPIGDKMRPRYILALRTAIKINDGSIRVENANPEHLSELKGMFNRCVRQDQWDWLTVYDSLSRPNFKLMQRAAQCISNLAKAVRQQDVKQIQANTEIFRRLDIEAILATALSKITDEVPKLAATLSLISTDSKLHIEDIQVDDETTYIISQVAKAKLERANLVHQETLNLLTRLLTTEGFVVQHNRLIDAFCRLKSGPAIFEIKSITSENERSQCRSALSQLYEYRYLHSMPEATLWLVLSSPPKLEWILEYFEVDRGVRVLWADGDSLKGRNVAQLLKAT